jgi:signal transduction histidine kinase
LLSGLVVLGLNIALSSWINTEPPRPQNIGIMSQFPRWTTLWFDLSDNEREKIMEIRKNDLITFQELSILSLIPISMISFILGYIIAGKFLKPIDTLADTLKDMQSEHLGKVLPKTSDDEVGRLIDSFNSMSVSLKASFDKQQQLVADASHEIKTPLAIIQTSLDSTLDDKGADKKELREAMNDALIGVQRLRKLADDLLTITAPFELDDTLNITEMVERQIEILVPYALRHNVIIEKKIGTKEERIRGNESKLGRSIYNLIENSIKFSKDEEKPKVVVSTEVIGSKAIITVSDNGPGIKKEAKEHVFDRFYRGRKDSEGNGLGLAISKNIIELHNGTIAILNQEKGTAFEIKLPILV